MNLLLINTANNELHIALKKGDNIFAKTLSSTMKHNESILPLIDSLLKENVITISDIDELGVIIGPGSFTGIRVGIAMTKAFADVNNIRAKGINNLDLLYNLAVSQNKDIRTVAITGSKDSYFVAKLINNYVYKYERNLTLNELLQVAEDSPIGMYAEDEAVKPFVVSLDAKILVDCYENTTIKDLIPVYYQLSQAENEKIKNAKIEIIDVKTDEQFETVAKLWLDHFKPKDIDKIHAFLNERCSINRLLLCNGEPVGFLYLQDTADEVCLANIAIRKEYRNMGFGSKLLDEAIEITKKLGYDALSLEVGENNISAYNLYKKYGFEQRRRRKDYYGTGVDGLEMVLKIRK